MIYQLGPSRLADFKKMNQAINNNDWKTAAKESEISAAKSRNEENKALLLSDK